MARQIDTRFKQHATALRQAARDNRGASLPFALFLFLICALLASVVISAGSAAAGRNTELASMDQRYYNVTSAANLVKHEFCDHPVTVTCVRTSTRKTTTPLSGDAASASTTNSAGSVQLAIDGKVVASGTGGLMLTNLKSLTVRERAALWIATGMSSSGAGAGISADDLWAQTSFGSAGSPHDGEKLTLQHELSTNTSGISNDVVKNVLNDVSVDEKVGSSRNLSFTISTGTDADKYAVALELATDIDASSRTEESDPVAVSTATSREETVTVTETHEATMTWSMLYMEKA